MHIEIQVALNFVISYLYNKLPRRRVNIFGEELEKALKDKFQGHWYPEKPFKGSAFRCLKTGDPIDAVLERAARESGVPINDILENLPNELSVWIDPGEVSYRIGEKGAVKILFSDNCDNHEDNSSADCEVNKTFNPEAQCFRPIDAINTSMNSLSLSPKTSPQSGSSPHSVASTSPTYKGSPNPAAGSAAAAFLQRQQQPLTFTTATFAQTKFGSTKLKTNSKRTNSSSYRMSPTEFSNYIKQRAMQQQLHHGHGPATPQANHFGPIGPVSPARSLSPNPLSLGMGQSPDPFYFPNIATMGMGYPQFNGHRNIFDAHFHAETNSLYGASTGGHSKFSAYLDPHGFYGLGNHMQQPQPQHAQAQNGNAKNGLNIDVNMKDASNGNNNGGASITVAVAGANNGGGAHTEQTTTPTSPAPPCMVASSNAATANNQDSNSSKLMDGLNSFYSNATGSYQQLLVAN